MRQYLRFGRGRARTFLKHRLRPGFRQLIVMNVMPAVALILLAPLHPGFALPAALWISGCVTVGLALATLGRHGTTGLAAGAIAGAMHLAWSAGFWWAFISIGRARPPEAALLEAPHPARPVR
jgi:succinoglycan biosynthesis protein ExoA